MYFKKQNHVKQILSDIMHDCRVLYNYISNTYMISLLQLDVLFTHCTDDLLTANSRQRWSWWKSYTET